MPDKQTSFYCPVCQQGRIFNWHKGANQINPQYHCAQCGFSDETRYLANPNLRSEEAQQSDGGATLLRNSSSGPSFFKTWFAGLSAELKALIILVPLFVVPIAFMLLFTPKADRKSVVTNVSSGSNKTPQPTPSVADLDSPEIQRRIVKGEQIYKRIAARTGLPVMFGYGAMEMKLLIPVSDWNKLSREDQISLTYHAEKLLREIKRDPKPYAKRWTDYYKRTEQLESGMEYDGLAESYYLQRLSNLCDTCWDITVGRAQRDGFYDERVPVRGTNVELFRRAATMN